MTLVYDNGEGLEFRRTIAVDDNYLFTIKDEVANKGTSAVTLYPYALISRHGTPPTLGYYILHEGLIGVLDDKLQECELRRHREEEGYCLHIHQCLARHHRQILGGDAAAPAGRKDRCAVLRFQNGIKRYQTSYNLDPVTVAPGATSARRDAAVCRRQGSLDCRRLQSRSSVSTSSTC